MPFFGFHKPLGAKASSPSKPTTRTSSSDGAQPSPALDTGDELPQLPSLLQSDTSTLMPSPSNNSTSILLPPALPPSTPPTTGRPLGLNPNPTITSTPASPIPSLTPFPLPTSDSFTRPDTGIRPHLAPRTVSHASRSSAASSFTSGMATDVSVVSSSGLVFGETETERDRVGFGSGSGSWSTGSTGGAADVGGREWKQSDKPGTGHPRGTESRGRKRCGLPPVQPADPSRAEVDEDPLRTPKQSGGGRATFGQPDEGKDGAMKEERRRRRAERRARGEGGTGGTGSTVNARDGKEKKERRARRMEDRVEQETYVIVRPPASNTKRPLNLQIQFVVPGTGTGRARTKSRSGSGSTGGTGVGSSAGAGMGLSPAGSEVGLGGVKGQGEGEVKKIGLGTRSPSSSSTASGMTASSYLGGLSDFETPALTETNTTTPDLTPTPERKLSGQADVGPGTDTPTSEYLGIFTRSPAGMEMYANMTGVAGGIISCAWAGLGFGLPMSSTTATTPVTPPEPTSEASSAVPPVAASTHPEVTKAIPEESTRERPESNNTTLTQTQTSATVRLKKAASDSNVRGKTATFPDRARRVSGGAILSRAGSVKSALSSAVVSGLSSGPSGVPMVAGVGRPRSFSGASLASSQGAGSGRRIVPLWNLSVHNVIHTRVTDAGTDAKVAKYTKRAIEIVDIGALEPTEYRTSRSSSLGLASPSSPLSAQSTRTAGTYISSEISGQKAPGSSSGFRASVDVKRLSAMFVSNAPSSPGTGKASIVSETSGIQPTAKPSPQVPEPFAGTKKIFGKLFKKKDGSTSVDLGDAGPASPASGRSMSAVQGEAPSPISLRGSMHAGNLPSEGGALGAPTFGCQPSLVGVSHRGRVTSYGFVMRKWSPVKAGPSALPLTLAPRLLDEASVLSLDVTIEWVRGKHAPRQRRQPIFERPFSPSALNTPPKTSSPQGKHPLSALRSRRISLTESTLSPRTSMYGAKTESGLKSSPMRRRPVSMISGAGTNSVEEDEGQESDPEDSETPWYCVVRCPGTSGRVREGGREITVVAVLYPAPHHPRVVGQIKLPSILPAIATGLVKPLSESSMSAELEEVWLSDENLKDIIGSTAMWLVVREKFGGLGKRKKAR